jgi:hypothetical protein
MIAFGTINVGTAIIAGGIGAILIWIIFAGAVASHGKDHGYSWGGLSSLCNEALTGLSRSDISRTPHLPL